MVTIQQPSKAFVLDISTASYTNPTGFILKNDTSTQLNLKVLYLDASIGRGDTSINTTFLPGWNTDALQTVYHTPGYSLTALKYCPIPTYRDSL